MKKCVSLLIVYSFLAIAPHVFFPVHASYVLPYPSYMPGNKMYTLSRVFDRLNNWWYFGSIAQIKYHLKLSDKYLVESETLFEYQQYLLAIDALGRSDEEFLKIPEHIQKAFQEGKDVSYLTEMSRAAALKHMEVLDGISEITPESFLWVPEKSASTQLDVRSHILDSLNIRKRISLEFSDNQKK